MVSQKYCAVSTGFTGFFVVCSTYICYKSSKCIQWTQWVAQGRFANLFGHVFDICLGVFLCPFKSLFIKTPICDNACSACLWVTGWLRGAKWRFGSMFPHTLTSNYVSSCEYLKRFVRKDITFVPSFSALIKIRTFVISAVHEACRAPGADMRKVMARWIVKSVKAGRRKQSVAYLHRYLWSWT